MFSLSLISLILTSTCMLVKHSCFTDVSTCPTNDPNLPTLAYWKNRLFSLMIKLSLNSLILTNTCVLAKHCCFTDDSTCPTNGLIYPTFSCWLIRLFSLMIMLSLIPAKLAYTFTSDISHHVQVFDDFIKFTHPRPNSLSPLKPPFATTYVHPEIHSL